MGKLFGTDGIRGIANQYPVDPEMGLKMGRATVDYYGKPGKRTKVVVGRDTRASGAMLEHALVSGILSMGGDALRVGEIPTPGVAFLTRDSRAEAGIMISASHNPHEYNGFKIFSGEGYKLSETEESALEDLALADIRPNTKDAPFSPGEESAMDEAGARYIAFLRKTISEKAPFEKMKIVLDCANGATSSVAPTLFKGLGADVDCLFVNPDGENINKKCGSQHPGVAGSRVLEIGADVGFAFDGDGDRVIAVDEKGRVLTGDHTLIICARALKARGELNNNLVVSTVMSNLGLPKALDEAGVRHTTTRVGDRYVVEEMRASGAVLGGEDSGHTLFLRHHSTGDGLLSAMQLLSAMKTLGQPLSQLSNLMTIFPQVTVNVAVKSKPEISEVPELVEVIHQVETDLGETGRVLVRYSGTEPVCRIMVEGEKQEQIDAYARRIADVVTQHLG